MCWLLVVKLVVPLRRYHVFRSVGLGVCPFRVVLVLLASREELSLMSWCWVHWCIECMTPDSWNVKPRNTTQIIRAFVNLYSLPNFSWYIDFVKVRILAWSIKILRPDTVKCSANVEKVGWRSLIALSYPLIHVDSFLPLSSM